MFKHNQMVIFFNNKKEDICDEKHKYLPQKGMGKVPFCSFCHSEKLPYFFTIHYYLLLTKKLLGRI